MIEIGTNKMARKTIKNLFGSLVIRPMSEKEIHLAVRDWVFLTFLIFLFLMVAAHGITGGFSILFNVQISSGMTIFSLLSFSIVLLGGAFWGSITAMKLNPELRGKAIIKQFFSSASRFVGLKKVGLRSFFFIILAFIIGLFFNLISTLVISSVVRNAVSSEVSSALTPNIIALFLVLTPIFEELAYRSIFISFFLHVFGKTRSTATIALIMSSVIFGFTHIGPTWLLFAKTMGGLMLGLIYLTKWGKNYFNSVAAHVGLNIIGIFTVIGT